MIGDSTIVGLNAYDNRLYAIGKGPSATTVDVGPKFSAIGNSIIIEGTVTDVSPGTEDIALRMRFPNGVPAVAEACMSEYMQYVYMQYERPEIEGIKVTLIVEDPNGEYYQTEVTTDDTGVFSHMWTPGVVGEYTVTAVFEGSKSYYTSYATATFGMDEASYNGPSADEIAQKTASEVSVEGIPAYLTIDLAIMALVAICLIIGIYLIIKKQ